MSEQAPWRLTAVGHATMLAEYGEGAPPITTAPGWHASSIHLDWMQNVYIGMGRDFAGSCLRTLCREGFYGGGDFADQLRRAFRAFKAWCRQHRVGGFERLLNGDVFCMDCSSVLHVGGLWLM